jgi:hypothetical protein
MRSSGDSVEAPKVSLGHVAVDMEYGRGAVLACISCLARHLRTRSLHSRACDPKASSQQCRSLEERRQWKSHAGESNQASRRNALKSAVHDRRLGGWRAKGGAVPPRLATKRDGQGLSAAERVVRCRPDWVESVEADFVPRDQRAQEFDVMRDVRARNQKGRAEAETITRFGCTPGTFRGAGDENSIRQRHALATGSTDDRE